MTILLNVVLPVFAIIFAGYLCGRLRLLGEGSIEGLNKFVYWIALPALLFRAMAEVDVAALLNWQFIGAYVGALLITMVVAMAAGKWLFSNSVAEAAMNGMNSVYGNTGFLGIPLMLAAFGEVATVPTVITVVVNTALVVAAATLLIELSSHRAKGGTQLLSHIVTALAKNPMLVAPMLGILWSLTSIPLPQAADRFCELLGAAAAPCALFSIGMFLVGKPIASNLGEVSVSLLIKLIMQPALTWWIASLLGMPPLLTAVAVIMAATPTGAGSFVMAQQYGIYVKQTSSVILLSTVLSLLTLFFLLYQFESLTL